MAKEGKVYRTDKLTLVAYTLLVFAYALFISLLYLKNSKATSFVLLLLLLVAPVVGYFIFLLKKRVIITKDWIEAFGLTGRKKIEWKKVISVSLAPGRRFFLFIEGEGGKLIVVDDSLEKFRELLLEIKEHLPKTKVPENYEKLVSSYRRSYTTLAILLIASLFLIFVSIKSLLFH